MDPAFVPTTLSITAKSSFMTASSRHALVSPTKLPSPSFHASRRHTPCVMVTVSRPKFGSGASFDREEFLSSSDSDRPGPETCAEIVASATTICDFMNTERVRDIASYVVQFGRNFVS